MKLFATGFLLFVFSLAYSQENFTVLSPEAYNLKLQESDSAYIIDVRTSFENKRGHLPEAININYLWFGFSDEADKLDRDKPVFLYCQTAHRSPLAAKKLHKMGFTQIYDLEGGFKAWEDQGLPVEK